MPFFASSVLGALREKPTETLQAYGFVTGAEDTHPYNTNVGGPCKTTISKLGGSVYELTAKTGVGDFYFPYRTSVYGGVGSCDVPIGQPDGTLALTGGMNGCALQVNKHNGVFTFYHDLNGNSMANMVTPGTRVCRVEYHDYAGRLELGRKSALDISVNPKDNWQAYFQHSVLCVRKNGRWNVYVSGIHTLKDALNPYKVAPEYRIFRPTLTPLITSFEDK